MFLILFAFITLYWYWIPKKDEESIRKYVAITAFAFFLLAGLRHMTIYNDTLGYVLNFKDIETMSMQKIIWRWPKDTFFYIVAYYLHPVLNHSYTLWLLLISAIYMYPVYLLVKKYSKNPMYSWWCFAFIGLMMFTMAGIRQTIAMGIVLYGFVFLLNGRNLYFFICIVLAYFFHASALIFLLVFPLVKLELKFTPSTIFFYLIAIVAVLYSGRTILKDVTEFIAQSDERFIGYAKAMHGSNYTYALQQLLLTVPSIYYLRGRLHEKNIALFAHIALIALIAVLMSPIIAEMFRVSMYFSWSIMILFPMAMQEAQKNGESILPRLYLILFIIYLVFINKTLMSDYYFWFEDVSEYINYMNLYYCL